MTSRSIWTSLFVVLGCGGDDEAHDPAGEGESAGSAAASTAADDDGSSGDDVGDSGTSSIDTGTDDGDAPTACTHLLTTDLGVPAGLAANQTAALSSALAGVPADAVVCLEGMYRADSTVTIDATFPAGVTLQPAPGLERDDVGVARIDYYSRFESDTEKPQRAQLVLSGAVGWQLRSFTIRGHHKRARYNTAFEGEPGLVLASCAGCLVDGLRIVGVGSDFIMMNGSNDGPSTDITVRNVDGYVAGRQGVSPSNADGVSFEDCRFAQIGRSGFDFEPMAIVDWSARNVIVQRTTIESFLNYGVAAGGSGVHENLAIEDTTIRGGRGWAKGGHDGDAGMRLSGGEYNYLGNGLTWVATQDGETFTDHSDAAWFADDDAFPVFSTTSPVLLLGWGQPFRRVQVELETPAAGLDGIVFEMWDGAAWVDTGPLVADGTNGFTQDGLIELDSVAKNAQSTSIAGLPAEYEMLWGRALRWDGSEWLEHTNDFADYGTSARVTLVADTDEAFYFGARAPFEGFKVYLVDAAEGLDAPVWEYWNGASWATLPATDATAGLTATRTTVTFAPPSDWAATIPVHDGATAVRADGSIDTAPHYYVRLRAAATPTVAPTVHNVFGLLTDFTWIRARASNVPTVAPTIRSLRTADDGGGGLGFTAISDTIVEDATGTFHTSGAITIVAPSGRVTGNTFHGVEGGLFVDSGGTMAIEVNDNTVTDWDGDPAPIVVQ